jgi:hypothetical protein
MHSPLTRKLGNFKEKPLCPVINAYFSYKFRFYKRKVVTSLIFLYTTDVRHVVNTCKSR